MNKNQQKLIHYCYDLLARRRYSIREMVKKLEARNAKMTEICSDQDLHQILESLAKANLLNDNDYANFYIDAQIRRKPVGRLKIRQQLRQRGLDEQVITQALNLAELDESVLAQKLLQKKIRHYQSSDLRDPKVRARLMRFLASNGFTLSQVKSALKHVNSSDQPA